nr:hypothetical protein [Brucella anthropi]
MADLLDAHRVIWVVTLFYFAAGISVTAMILQEIFSLRRDLHEIKHFARLHEEWCIKESRGELDPEFWPERQRDLGGSKRRKSS